MEKYLDFLRDLDTMYPENAAEIAKADQRRSSTLYLSDKQFATCRYALSLFPFGNEMHQISEYRYLD